MFGIFRSQKKKKDCTPAEAIRQLRENEAILLKKQELLEEKIDNQIKIAKANGTKNKRVALKALREKKRYEKQLQEIDGTRNALEMQRETLEGTISNVAVLDVLKVGSKALKKAHNNINVDVVHGIIDNTAEQIDLFREISDAISTPLFAQDISEEDLEHEFVELEQELLELPSANLQLPSPVRGSPSPVRGSVGKVPTRPSSADDEQLLKELLSWSS